MSRKYEWILLGAQNPPASSILHYFSPASQSLSQDSPSTMVATRRKDYGPTALPSKSKKTSIGFTKDPVAGNARVTKQYLASKKAPALAKPPSSSSRSSPAKSPSKSPTRLPTKLALKSPIKSAMKSPAESPAMLSTIKSPTRLLPRSSPTKSPKRSLAESRRHFSVIEHYNQDFFANIVPNSLLIHACNCTGIWGAGIAKVFRNNYPNAYKKYHDHCKQHSPEELRGTALLIAPMDGKPHWIGCIMTSAGHGNRVDPPQTILSNTHRAMVDLLTMLNNAISKVQVEFSKIQIAQINSGLFNVPWRETRKVLENSNLYPPHSGTLDFTSDEIHMVTNAPG